MLGHVGNAAHVSHASVRPAVSGRAVTRVVSAPTPSPGAASSAARARRRLMVSTSRALRSSSSARRRDSTSPCSACVFQARMPAGVAGHASLYVHAHATAASGAWMCKQSQAYVPGGHEAGRGRACASSASCARARADSVSDAARRRALCASAFSASTCARPHAGSGTTTSVERWCVCAQRAGSCHADTHAPCALVPRACRREALLGHTILGPVEKHGEEGML